MEIDIEKLTCGIQLTDIERNVLEYLLTHLDQALKLGVRGVARENFTSTSTVMRLSRKLGYNGLLRCIINFWEQWAVSAVVMR